MLGSNDSTHLENRIVDSKEAHGILPIYVYLPLKRFGSKAVKSPTESNHTTPKPWRSTILRFGPITGILAMFVAMTSLIASLGILVGSQGADTSSRIGEPSIYLAAFTAVANLSMRYACIQGVAITWWKRATRGSTVSELHRNWKAGTSMFGVIVSGRKMGAIGLACVFSSLVVMDGPVSKSIYV